MSSAKCQSLCRDYTLVKNSTERALGLLGSVEDDTIKFNVRLKESSLTRRGILSTISSDPLGIASPLVLGGKLTLLELRKLRLIFTREPLRKLE